MRLTRLLLAPLLFWASAAWAADYQAGPADYRDVLRRLQAGDRLLLAAGDYLRGLPLQGLRGEPGRPIRIEGPASGGRARFVARPGANTVSLVDVDHITLRNLELDGRNLPVDAIKAEGHARFAHHVTLEGLHIHDHAANQQSVGISTKCPALGWVIRGNRIERVGTGLYLGNSNGMDPFVGGLIEDNHVSDTLGYNLQIKHQKTRGELPDVRDRHDTIIRRNFFSKAGALPGPQGRPNVLVGHFPPEGPGKDDRYLVYANVFWQNPTEALFQGEGNLAIYNNVFVNHQGPAIRIQPHNDVPRTVDLLGNTVLARDGGIAIRLREGQPEFPRRLWQNLVFAGQPLMGGDQRHNLVGNWDAAARHLVDPYPADLTANLTPRAPLATKDSPAGDLVIRPSSYPDLDRDLTGRTQPADRIGALGAGNSRTLAQIIGRDG